MPAHRLELDLLGARFALSTADDTWAAVLEDLWQGFRTTVAGPADDVGIEVTGKDMWLQLPGEPRLHFDQPWQLAEVLRHWLVEAALKRTSGLTLIHAATVVCDDGALLLVGPSGAGKTSLTLGLLDAGWALGSDDIAPLDRATGTIRPFPKPLGIRDPKLWNELGRSDWPLPWPEHPGSPILVPPRLFGRADRPFEARWIAFIRWGADEEPLLERLSGARAAARLVEHAREVSPGALAGVAELARGALAADVRYRSTAQARDLLKDLTKSPI